jgi:hypothetical protein
MVDIVKERKWYQPPNVTSVEIVKRHFTPVGKRDTVIQMFDRHIWAMRITPQNLIECMGWKDSRFDDEIILWFGSTPSWALIVYENTSGVMVYHTATREFATCIVDNGAVWRQRPVVGPDGWLYKISDNRIERVRLQTDEDVLKAEWEHVKEYDHPVLAMVVVCGAIKAVEHNSALFHGVDQMVDCGGRWVVSLYGCGKVIAHDPTLTRVLSRIVESGCHLLQVQGTFVAMAGQFFNSKRHLVIVHDLASGWCAAVETRGYVSEMQWTRDGQLIALSGKTVFRVGGERVGLLKRK